MGNPLTKGNRISPAFAGALAVAMVWPGWCAAAALNEIAASAGIQFNHVSEALAPIGAGVAWVDVDDDGDIDIYFGDTDGLNAFYRNDFPTDNNWLKVKVLGTVGNRDGIGARVILVAAGATQMRAIRAGSGFLSRDSLTAHFGLGTADTVDRLAVTFLSGLRYEFVDVAARQTVMVVEVVVTGQFPVDTLTISAGDPIPVSITVGNRTDTQQSIEFWIDYVSPSGTEQTLYGPFDRTLQAGGGFSRPLTIPDNPGVQLGTHNFVMRVGAYPDASVHQDYLLVDVIP